MNTTDNPLAKLPDGIRVQVAAGLISALEAAKQKKTNFSEQLLKTEFANGTSPLTFTLNAESGHYSFDNAAAITLKAELRYDESLELKKAIYRGETTGALFDDKNRACEIASRLTGQDYFYKNKQTTVTIKDIAIGLLQEILGQDGVENPNFSRASQVEQGGFAYAKSTGSGWHPHQGYEHRRNPQDLATGRRLGNPCSQWQSQSTSIFVNHKDIDKLISSLREITAGQDLPGSNTGGPGEVSGPNSGKDIAR